MTHNETLVRSLEKRIDDLEWSKESLGRTIRQQKLLIRNLEKELVNARSKNISA